MEVGSGFIHVTEALHKSGGLTATTTFDQPSTQTNAVSSLILSNAICGYSKLLHISHLLTGFTFLQTVVGSAGATAAGTNLIINDW